MHGSLGSTLSPIAWQEADKSRPPAMAVASVVSGSIHRKRDVAALCGEA